MSDEVSDFLRSVEALKERREEEDEARSRELEEKILQEKRERQARRAGKYKRKKKNQQNTPPTTPLPPPPRAAFCHWLLHDCDGIDKPRNFPTFPFSHALVAQNLKARAHGANLVPNYNRTREIYLTSKIVAGQYPTAAADFPAQQRGAAAAILRFGPEPASAR